MGKSKGTISMQATTMIDYTRLAKNAKVGDGTYWIHPECVRHKLVFTGTNKEHLEFKAKDIGRNVSLIRPANSARLGVYSNSKPLFSFTTLVDDMFTQYNRRVRLDVLEEFDMFDMVLWFLDDGCTIERRDNKRAGCVMRYRYFMCVGSLCSAVGAESRFLSIMQNLFGEVVEGRIGSIQKNNSKATVNNRNWLIPVSIAKHLVREARKLQIPGFEDKLRMAGG